MMSDDPWKYLASLTPARIGIGRTGSGLPTTEALKFALAHAQARDAVHAPFAPEAIGAELAALGLPHLSVSSGAVSRQSYLLRPDLGRRLDAVGRNALAEHRATGGVDLVLVIADGLSARAVHAHAVPLVAALLPRFRLHGWSLGPVVLVTQGRVAIGDEIGDALGARLALVMIGERPGLSSPDSLGLYMTFAPEPGRTDGERNCLSNIHAGGMSIEEAAFKTAWLLKQAFSRRLTGVDLKDESDASLADDRSQQAIGP